MFVSMAKNYLVSLAHFGRRQSGSILATQRDLNMRLRLSGFAFGVV